MAQTRADDQKRDPQTYAIIGASMTVHSELGHGLLEAVYHDALAIELDRRNIPFVREQHLPIIYTGVQLPTHYQADFVCFDSIIVELKALSALESSHEAQVINYLKATGHQRGLLINFGTPQLQYKRLVRSVDFAQHSRQAEEE